MVDPKSMCPRRFNVDCRYVFVIYTTCVFTLFLFDQPRSNWHQIPAGPWQATQLGGCLQEGNAYACVMCVACCCIIVVLHVVVCVLYLIVIGLWLHHKAGQNWWGSLKSAAARIRACSQDKNQHCQGCSDQGHAYIYIYIYV